MIGAWLDRLRHIRRRRLWTPDKALGRRGEDLAHRFLRRQGFIIVARNYRLASGAAEADLIAWDKDVLVFVEVKTRASGEWGPPERAIGIEKQGHMKRVAREYAGRTGIPWERVRFDSVGVLCTEPPQISHERGILSDRG